jgi:hypothetical protein
MQATTIDEVLSALSAIIDDSIRTNSRAGFFAALYYKVTSSVKEGILHNRFDDGPRMEQLDVTFANRYLDAYTQWKNKLPMTGAWRVAFETVEQASPLVLQQLFLGMNAHINLDLGIATVETMKGKDLQGISNDFNNINLVIASLTNEVIRDLDRISPLLSIMGLHASNNNSILIQFSIGSARDGAWRFAEELSAQTGAAYDKCVADRDENITKLAESLVHTGFLLRLTIWVIHLFEWKRPSRIIEQLHNFKKPYLKVAQMKG